MNQDRLKFWKKPISLHTFILGFSVWITLSLNFIFFEKLYQLTPYKGFPAILFIGAMVVLLTSYFNFIFNLLMWRWNVKILAFIFLFIGGATTYFNYLGIGIDAYQIQNLIETDPHEARDLMSLNILLWVAVLLVLPLSILSLFKIKKDKLLSTLKFKGGMALGSFLMVSLLVFIYYADLAAILRENRNLKGFISPQSVFSSTWSYYKKLAPKDNIPLQQYARDAVLQLESSYSQPKLLVLVIGETARAENFSLNGYARNTNPELSKLPILNFTQVVSCGTSTAVSVPCMFSGMPRKSYDPQVARHRENLLDILQHAGYHVIWMDNNSGCKEVCNRVEQYQFPKVLQDKWCKGNECADDILLDGLHDYLQNMTKNDKQPRVIVLHQMGSHGPAYYKRSPIQFQHFQPFCNTNAIQGCSQQDLLNVYDNSIVYTDYILAKVIKQLQIQTKYQTAMWYLSDHGESLGEHGLYLHGAPYLFAPSQQTHVPMVLWFSKQWKVKHPEVIQCLNLRKNQKVSQDNLFPTVLSLMDVKTATKNPQLDLLANCKKTFG
ncbi:MAG: phosphoethanolamine--lipid A transferase [Acinetobacter populi]|jgi:lipid A ethanolaminephosphotransferase|uniref:phosphoethanolamine transferase n=1 Tax=Acinetobacter populi TaxID=1582270 RepID=UPI0023568BD2|nr:phosphoethanolamine--lipid A transferase [Acinetobacter populi]MCH4248088.1 phosphoethanolamine--lipid A transferase [Acinetobacter populi]